MSDPPTEVAVTGLGAVAAPCCGSIGLWQALLDGRSGIVALDDNFSSELRSPIAARVQNFQPVDDPRTTDPFVQFALAATYEALDRAGLMCSVDGPRTAIIMGTGIGGETTHDREAQRWHRDGAARADPLAIPKLMPSAAASRIAISCGVTGPVFSVTSACASATHAIGLAFQLIRAGAVDIAIAGGSEACLTVGVLRAWEALRIVAPDCCRPFSLGRKGMVLGEGAGNAPFFKENPDLRQMLAAWRPLDRTMREEREDWERIKQERAEQKRLEQRRSRSQGISM